MMVCLVSVHAASSTTAVSIDARIRLHHFAVKRHSQAAVPEFTAQVIHVCGKRHALRMMYWPGVLSVSMTIFFAYTAQ